MASLINSLLSSVEGFFSFFGIYSKIAAAKEQAILDLQKEGYYIEELEDEPIINDEEGAIGGVGSDYDDSDSDAEEDATSDEDEDYNKYVHTDSEGEDISA